MLISQAYLRPEPPRHDLKKDFPRTHIPVVLPALTSLVRTLDKVLLSWPRQEVSHSLVLLLPHPFLWQLLLFLPDPLTLSFLLILIQILILN